MEAEGGQRRVEKTELCLVGSGSLPLLCIYKRLHAIQQATGLNAVAVYLLTNTFPFATCCNFTAWLALLVRVWHQLGF